MAERSELPGVQADGPLAAETPIPPFTLEPVDCARLLEIIEKYGPYNNGETAVFWHLVGIMGEHRKPREQNSCF